METPLIMHPLGSSLLRELRVVASFYHQKNVIYIFFKKGHKCEDMDNNMW